MRQVDGMMRAVNDLREQGRMTWLERGGGWTAELEEVLDALARDGFEECKRETTTSRRDCRPVGGIWQGVNPITGSVASAIWVARPAPAVPVMFVEIDGESITRPGRDPGEEEGGEG